MTSIKPRKREVTRAKVIQAAIDCIYAEGFYAAHTNRIAEQAGVSWGVLQYHFGDKDGLLQAVLDTIFANFTASLSKAKLQQEQLKPRIGELVNTLWLQVSQPEYRVSIAILRNAGRDPESSIDGRKNLARWSSEVAVAWDKLFVEYRDQPIKSATARRLLFAALRGLADELNPSDKTTRNQLNHELAALTDAIHFLLTEETT